MEISEEVLARGKELFKRRVKTLSNLFDNNAPPGLLAAQLGMLEKALWLMAPEEFSRHLCRSNHAKARAAVGLCTHPSCSSPNIDSDLCQVHCDELMKEIAELDEM